MTSSTREVVDGYTTAWTRGEIDAAGSYLCEHLRFRGRIDHFDRASHYLDALRRFRALVTKIDFLSRFYEGDEAALLYDCETDTRAGAIRTAEFLRVTDGKIDRIRLVFDATRLRPLLRERV